MLAKDYPPSCIALLDDRSESISESGKSCRFKCPFDSSPVSSDALSCPYFGQKNMIIRCRPSQIYIPGYKGVLSIKSTDVGEEIYETDKKIFTVDANHLLVLNEGQEYSSYVKPNSKAKSFCLFFGNQYVQDVYQTIKSPIEKLLVEKPEIATSSIVVSEQVIQENKTVLNMLKNMKMTIDLDKDLDLDWLKERFYHLLQTIFYLQNPDFKKIDNMTAKKPSTRIELFHRLQIAKEFMDSCFEENLSLAEIAEVANLSAYHFLRVFNNIFQETPREYINGKRFKKACNMLVKTKKSITDIALEAGFGSSSYFCRKLREKFKATPAEFRLINS